MTEAARPRLADVNLEQLLSSYQQGDTAAAAALVRAVSPMFVRFCISQGDSSQDVDDIVQEIWLRVHKARHTYRPDAPGTPWLYAIARHARLDARRRRLRFRSREFQVDALPEVPAPDVEGGSAPLPAEVLAALPAAQREVLTMLKGCGMTLEEVARATSSTVGAVKQKAHRAYVCLRKTLNEVAGRRQL
jgi:RNA polymerase sigma-70 factor (ECF subfamily)